MSQADFTEKDFEVAAQYRGAPIGEISGSNPDITGCANMPLGPDGEPFVTKWDFPTQIPYLKKQGYLPCPAKFFETGSKGRDGSPAIAASPTAKPGAGALAGFYVKEGGTKWVQVLFITTAKNHQRLIENHKKVNKMAMSGAQLRERNDEVASREFANAIRPGNLPNGMDRTFEEDSLAMAAEREKKRQRGAVSVSLAGPRMQGSGEESDG